MKTHSATNCHANYDPLRWEPQTCTHFFKDLSSILGTTLQFLFMFPSHNRGPKTLIRHCYCKRMLTQSLNVTRGSCFYCHAKRIHQVQSNTDRKQITSRSWWHFLVLKMPRAALRNVPVFAWWADRDPEPDYRSWHRFFQTLLFPICLEQTSSCFKPCAISWSGWKLKHVG